MPGEMRPPLSATDRRELIAARLAQSRQTLSEFVSHFKHDEIAPPSDLIMNRIKNRVTEFKPANPASTYRVGETDRSGFRRANRLLSPYRRAAVSHLFQGKRLRPLDEQPETERKLITKEITAETRYELRLIVEIPPSLAFNITSLRHVINRVNQFVAVDWQTEITDLALGETTPPYIMESDVAAYRAFHEMREARRLIFSGLQVDYIGLGMYGAEVRHAQYSQDETSRVQADILAVVQSVVAHQPATQPVESIDAGFTVYYEQLSREIEEKGNQDTVVVPIWIQTSGSYIISENLVSTLADNGLKFIMVDL